MPSHVGFIVAAYAVTGVVLLATIAAIVLDYRAQRRAIARLSPDRDRTVPGDQP